MNSFTVTAVGNLAKNPELASRAIARTPHLLGGQRLRGQGRTRKRPRGRYQPVVRRIREPGRGDREKCAEGRSAHSASANPFQ